MVPILTPAEMAAVDAAAPEPAEVLIDRAGRAVARAAIEMMGGTYGRVVNVLAGKGNNGADGRVAAELLRSRGVRVRVFEAVFRPPVLPRADLVIDAAFGTGFRGEWTAPEVGGASVLAVDIPSGVDALTGRARPGVLPADRTVTFQALKPGLVFGEGAQLAGRVDVVDIGLDVGVSSRHLVEAADVGEWWPTRAYDAHKWKAAVRVVAGSPGMTGAARLASTAASRSGAGLVKLSIPGMDIDVSSEIVQHRIANFDWSADVLADISRFGSLVIGPGIGREEFTVPSVRATIADATVPVVVDGDAIFAAAWDSDGPHPLFADRGLATVLTPHDGEFSVLTGSRPGSDRLEAARSLAADLGCTIVLKGPTTVVASTDGPTYVVDHGDERLATAGSGDVLAGMIGAVLARGAPAARGVAAAVWLHAEAARRCGPVGVVAGDLVDAIPDAIGDVVVGRADRSIGARRC